MSDVFIAEQAINDILNALEVRTGSVVERIDIDEHDVTSINDESKVVKHAVRITMGRSMNRWGK